MQAETSVQTVYEAGALVSRCRWWGLLACSELARQATKQIFRGRPVPACRLPGVALERMLVLDLCTHMACILESECAHECLFISVFRDIGHVQSAVVITIGQGCMNISGRQHLCTLELAGGHQPSI
jgi:hypothetical protein